MLYYSLTTVFIVLPSKAPWAAWCKIFSVAQGPEVSEPLSQHVQEYFSHITLHILASLEGILSLSALLAKRTSGEPGVWNQSFTWSSSMSLENSQEFIFFQAFASDTFHVNCGQPACPQ